MLDEDRIDVGEADEQATEIDLDAPAPEQQVPHLPPGCRVAPPDQNLEAERHSRRPERRRRRRADRRRLRLRILGRRLHSGRRGRGLLDRRGLRTCEVAEA